MVLHCIIINEDPQTVELFTDLRSATERYKTLLEEGKNITITSAEI